MKRLLALALATAVAAGSLGVVPAEAYTDSGLGANKIGRVGSATKTVYKGGELDLEVRKGVKMKDSNIKWSIGNTSILRFDDDDRYDDEIEVRVRYIKTVQIVCGRLIRHLQKKCGMCWKSINRSATSEAVWQQKKNIYTSRK